MLSKVFDLQETHSPVRDEKIAEVLMLRNELNRLKKQGKLSTQQGEKLYNEYIKLAQKLSWEFELPQYEKA
jgi:ribosomal protein L19E